MKLRNTRKWAEGRPILPSAMSVQFAFAADEAYGLMMALRHVPEFRSAFRVQNPQEWLSLYRRHRLIEVSVLRDHWDSFGVVLSSKSMMGALKSYRETGKPTVLSLPQERLAEEMKSFAQDMSNDIWSSLESRLAEQEKVSYEERLEEWRKLPSEESMFCFRVWFPCWLEYGVSAGRLLRDARHGDIQAIDHILRLDELTLQDPRIMLHFSEARRNRAKGRFKRMYVAIGNFPERKLTPKNTKECIGALISRFSENLGCRISGPDIRRLYDAIAQDVKGGRIDLDFANEEPESFSRAIRRHRSFWEPLFKSGWPLPSNPA